ncbi:MAG: histidine--tRNA ligase [Alphaproteobacteria bacterium]|nr:histidine--tRNA ligase [Alphaproteobacteria bacterium]
MKIQPARGTRDIYGADLSAFLFVENTARAFAKRYGFGEIQTPVFEATEVFARGVGETSDIVSKEMYTFTDRGGESFTLRPEGTAGVVRAFISEGMEQNVPVKLFYAGPMFRYERPQKGRYRQLHQVGVEVLGAAVPQTDVEVLCLGWDFLSALGLQDYIRLELNTLGDAESRAAYRKALVSYFEQYKDKLSEDSLNRLEKNPLRILDSKDEGDKKIIENAPAMTDYLNEESRAFFEEVKNGLTAMGIPFVVNPRLVRGLDYYRHTVFEFITDSLGAQGTVLGGGRYDGLVEELGGPQTPGIGFGAGIDRLSLLLQEVGKQPAEPRPIAVIPVGADTMLPIMQVAHTLRQNGFIVDMAYSGNMGKRMKKANKINACAAVIMGSDEHEKGVVTVRDLDSGDQSEVAVTEISAFMQKYKASQGA